MAANAAMSELADAMPIQSCVHTWGMNPSKWRIDERLFFHV